MNTKSAAIVTAAVPLAIAGGWYVKQIVVCKIEYRKFKKLRARMAV